MKLFYHCEDCDFDWRDICHSHGNDQCPVCGKWTAPFDAEDFDDDDEDFDDDDEDFDDDDDYDNMSFDPEWDFEDDWKDDWDDVPIYDHEKG